MCIGSDIKQRKEYKTIVVILAHLEVFGPRFPGFLLSKNSSGHLPLQRCSLAEEATTQQPVTFLPQATSTWQLGRFFRTQIRSTPFRISVHWP